jgi:hypothetical protein
MCPRAPECCYPPEGAHFSPRKKSARRNWAPRQANRKARAFRPTESPNRETSGTISLADVVLANRFLAVLRTCFGRYVMSPRGDARGPLPHSLHKHQTEKMAFCLSASTSTFVGAKVAAKPTAARRTARYVSGRHRARARRMFPDERCAVCPNGRRRVRSARRDAIESDAAKGARRSRCGGPRSIAVDSRTPPRAPRRSRRSAPRGDIETRDARPVTTARQSVQRACAFFRAFRRLENRD